MRTTVSLDDDVAAKLHDRMTRYGATFKETLNDCLRRGLDQSNDDDLAATFTIKPRSMGLRPGVNLDDISGTLELLDGPTHP